MLICHYCLVAKIKYLFYAVTMSLPPPPKQYRPNVGLLIFNQNRKAWIGRRRGFRGDYCWQTPQGGIDKGEDFLDAALRELTEETGIGAEFVTVLERNDEWLCYDFPAFMRKNKLNHYRGQAQLWFALEFSGEDSLVKLDNHSQIEFDDWRWEDLSKLPNLVVPFKRDVYEKVATRFAHLSKV